MAIGMKKIIDINDDIRIDMAILVRLNSAMLINSIDIKKNVAM